MLNASPTKNPSTRCSSAPVEVTVYTVCSVCVSPAGGRTTRPVSRYFASRSLAEKELPFLQADDPTARVAAFTSYDPDPDPDYLAWHQQLVLLDEVSEGVSL